MDGVPEPFEAEHEALLDPLAIQDITVEGAKFSIRPPLG